MIENKDLDIKLWSYIQIKSTFFNLQIDKVTELLKNDLSVNHGIVKLKLLKFPKLTENDLKNEYKERIDLKGNESKIYFSKDDQYIYKLNDPGRKSFNKRFNEIIMYYILQNYLFPDCKYDDLKIYRDEMFVRQRFTDSLPPDSDKQIELYMNNDGYEFSDETLAWIKDIEDISVRISDLNSANCRIKENKLEVIDPRIRIYYEKYIY